MYIYLRLWFLVEIVSVMYIYLMVKRKDYRWKIINGGRVDVMGGDEITKVEPLVWMVKV